MFIVAVENVANVIFRIYSHVQRLSAKTKYYNYFSKMNVIHSQTDKQFKRKKTIIRDLEYAS